MYCEDGQTQEQVAQKGYWASILRDTQTQTGQSCEQPALGGPTWPGGWTRWSPEAPACLSHLVILWFCPTASNRLQTDNPPRYISLSDSIPSSITLCVCSHPYSPFLYVWSHPRTNNDTHTANLQIVSKMSYITLTKALLKLRRNTWTDVQTQLSFRVTRSLSQAIIS